MRGISLDEISSATKIGTRSLKALEEENFTILPGGIFNKGFVRAYAKFLGLNEDEAVADYQVAANEQPVSVKQIAAQSAIAKANRLAAQQKSESNNFAALARVAGLLLLVVVLGYGGYKAYSHGVFRALRLPSLHRQLKQPPVAASASTNAPAQTAASQPLASTQAASPTPTPVLPAPPAPAEFTVGIKTSEASWLSVTADGRRTIQRMFEANEQQTVTAKSQVRIVIGNPNGTEISLNGKPLALGGDLTHSRTVTVGSNGLQD